jgi:hypothetical protein
LLGVPEEHIRILRVTEGSINIELTLPEEAAQRLEAMYQNNDPALEQLQVKMKGVQVETHEDVLRSVLRKSETTIQDITSDLGRTSALARGLALVLVFDRDLVRDLALHLASDLARNLASDLALARNLASDLALARNLASDLALARDLVQASALASASANAIASDLARANAIASDLALHRDFHRDLARNLASDLARASGLAGDHARESALHLDRARESGLADDHARESALHLDRARERYLHRANAIVNANAIALFLQLSTIADKELGPEHEEVVAFKQAVKEFQQSLQASEENDATSQDRATLWEQAPIRNEGE